MYIINQTKPNQPQPKQNLMAFYPTWWDVEAQYPHLGRSRTHSAALDQKQRLEGVLEMVGWSSSRENGWTCVGKQTVNTSVFEELVSFSPIFVAIFLWLPNHLLEKSEDISTESVNCLQQKWRIPRNLIKQMIGSDPPQPEECEG